MSLRETGYLYLTGGSAVNSSLLRTAKKKIWSLKQNAIHAISVLDE